ncbi:MAG: TetR/AcrR family transcriptional regulator, partial [Candidatus Dormibacteria bacterium]
AGVSRKTFYELFKDKEEALLTAYIGNELLIDAIIGAAAERARTSGATATDLIAAGARGMLQTLADAPAFTRTFFIEALGAGPRVRERRDAAIEQLAAAIGPLLLALQAAEQPDQPPIDHDLVRGLIGACTDAVIRHLVHHEPQTLGQLEPTLTKLTRRLVCAVVDDVRPSG